ncbi:MAG: proteasome accessory factor PafA2 family protein [Actinomycetaceae bacterium]|nr:proteasome accessory factor PafA2 family protein [Actinomycetaceae bacterium]
MSVHRIVGTETEYGIIAPDQPTANPVALSTFFVRSYSPFSRHGGTTTTSTPVFFDYYGEDPLRDARGFSLTRASADPSQLTDDPSRPAPSGPSTRTPQSGVHTRTTLWLPTRCIQQKVARPSPEVALTATAANCILSNGARFYVDHAHPEYSSPETLTPRQAVLYDRAGEELARRAMTASAKEGHHIVVYKNNVDGKGASYGTHENYLIDRGMNFHQLAQVLIPFFATRVILCGSGRVGIGQRSEHAGFQISARADYVENDIGLETTFNRPIVNTRDEPHADARRFRRLHVIGGDANQFDISLLLKIGTTSAVLWLCEHTDFLHTFRDYMFAGDPVKEVWNISHDTTLTYRSLTCGGKELSALDYQQFFLDTYVQAATAQNVFDEEAQFLVHHWQQVLTGLATDRMAIADSVEWVAKLNLLDAMRQRLGSDWSHPKLAAMDLMWADMRLESSLVASMDRAGQVQRIFSAEHVSQALDQPPTNTRAWLRGKLVSDYDELLRAGWCTALLDTGEKDLIRVTLGQPAQLTSQVRQALDSGSIQAVIDALICEEM